MPDVTRVGILSTLVLCLAACFRFPHPEAGRHTETVRILLDRAPDPGVSDNLEGTISVWIARLSGRTEILKTIEGPCHGA